MKLLLDTHTFLWWDSDPNRIPPATCALMEESNNELLVSLVSFWEIQIKTQLGKLTLRTTLSSIIFEQQEENGILILPITLPHILELDNLPQHHKDPFDRLLIAKSRQENIKIVSKDSAFNQYDCQILW
jgi:PIN domain nuclease of toxin-antitoxin system